MDKVVLNWKGGMEYDAVIGEHIIRVDAGEDVGGANLGPRPKPLMLVALAGCTGMDVASLARKMRVEFENIAIEAEAEKTEEIPTVYTRFKLIYRFAGSDSDTEKALKMVNLSQERYCGVAAMLRQIAPLDYEIYLNDRLIG